MIYNIAIALQILLSLTSSSVPYRPAEKKTPLTFAGKRLPEVLTIMKEWGYDSLVRVDSIQMIYFINAILPGANDSCLVAVNYSPTSDTIIDARCIKVHQILLGSKKLPLPAVPDTADFVRWKFLLTRELGPPAGSYTDSTGLYLHWSGEKETFFRYAPASIVKGFWKSVNIQFQSFWKREKKDGSHYTEAELRMQW